MKNDEPEPMISEPELFRRAFGDKARDPGDVADRLRADEAREAERNADRFQTSWRGPEYILAFAVVLYLFGLFEPRPTLSEYPSVIGIAFVLWALGVVFWIPWIIFRVDRRAPRGDSARAAAILAYGLLGWPLAVVPLTFALAIGLPDRAPDLMFPVVSGCGGASIVLAYRATQPTAPTGRRAAFLAGGALIYLACTAGLARLLLGPMLQAVRNAEGGAQDFDGFVMFLVALIALMTAFLAVRLARSALRAWRGRSPALVALPLAAQLLNPQLGSPVGSTRVALMSGAAALVCACAALTLLSLAVLGGLMAVWEPPPGGSPIGPLTVAVCLALGLACTYGAVGLFRAALRAWRGRNLTAAAP